MTHFEYGVHIRSVVRRIQKLSKNTHLFLFGARGTGKSTLLSSLFANHKFLKIDLLTDADEDHFGQNPSNLSAHLKTQNYEYVIIDEIQKFPKLLDIVHYEIEHNLNCPKFILTGSSARKLKRNNANLLGGRAVSYSLYPFSFLEIEADFNLIEILKYGSLPVLFFKDESLKQEHLRSYIKNYLKEEILVEQIVRQIDSFRDFLEVAAQMNGQIINYSKIAKEVGVSDQTIKSFFQILEDTLVGFVLPPFHRSIRKRQKESPKFYFFDLGVVRALKKHLTLPILPETTDFGDAFEHLVILEIYRMCDYLKNDFTLSFLRTKDNAEIDLVINRPGKPDLLIEIKSTNKIESSHAKTANQFLKSWDQDCVAQVWSLDPINKIFDQVECVYWIEGLKRLTDN